MGVLILFGYIYLAARVNRLKQDHKQKTTDKSMEQF